MRKINKWRRPIALSQVAPPKYLAAPATSLFRRTSAKEGDRAPSTSGLSRNARLDLLVLVGVLLFFRPLAFCTPLTTTTTTQLGTNCATESELNFANGAASSFFSLFFYRQLVAHEEPIRRLNSLPMATFAHKMTAERSLFAQATSNERRMPIAQCLPPSSGTRSPVGPVRRGPPRTSLAGPVIVSGPAAAAAFANPIAASIYYNGAP